MEYERETKIVYPEIYRWKTPQKHKFIFVDFPLLPMPAFPMLTFSDQIENKQETINWKKEGF